MANDTRTRMLEATALLIRQRGYHGTSLSDILAASGAPRGSLYFHFPGGKDQLVIEVTRNSVAEVAERLEERLATEKSPAAAIRAIFASVGEMLEKNDFAFGCPIAPVVLDATTNVPELLEIARSAFERWIGLLQSSFAKAGVPEPRSRALALLVESSLEGLMVIARATRDRSILPVVADELAAMADAAVAANDG
ncbi:MAG TPA: TetR/AcrR family transcriptional regulator [Rhizobiaceae bacterium]|nr:TetR/AcrR family transcriptional regulator [Rhizobiaceae bacterium]